MTASIRLTQGDDYSTIGQGPIEFTISNAPNLVGATITLEITQGATAAVTATGTLASGIYPAAQVVQVPLTDTQTNGLARAAYGYRLRAVLSNGDVVTLDHGETGSVFVTRAV